MSWKSKKMKVNRGEYNIHAKEILEQYDVTKEQLLKDAHEKGLRYFLPARTGAYFQREQIEKLYSKKEDVAKEDKGE